MKHLLSGFKKVASDKNTTTFKHKNGHEIKIAHKALKGDLKKEVDALPKYDDGGVVDQNNSADVAGLGFSGGSRDPASASSPAQANATQATFDAANPSHAPNVPSDQSYDAPQGAPTSFGPQGAPTSFPKPTIVKDSESLNANLNGPAVTKKKSETDNADTPLSAQANYVKSGLDLQERGLMEGAFNKEDQASEMKDIYQNLSDYESGSTPGQPGGFNNIIQDALRHVAAHKEQIQNAIQNGAIDVNHFWKDQSVGSKIGTAIGVLFSGFGSGMNHQGNAAIDYIEKAMNNDLNAQYANLGAKETLLSDNHKDLGDTQLALGMTKMNHNDAVMHQLQATAAKYGGMNAFPEAFQLYGKLKQENAFLLAMMGNHLTQDPAAWTSFFRANGKDALADNMEKKMIPGQTQGAAIPIPQDVRDKLINHDEFVNKLQQYKQLLDQAGPIGLSKDPSKITSLIGQSSALYNDILSLAPKDTDSTRISNITDSYVRERIPKINSTHLTDIDSSKVDEAIKQAKAGGDAIRNGYGIPVTKKQGNKQIRFTPGG